MKINEQFAEAKIDVEKKLTELRNKVVSWFPNFTKYAEEKSYEDRLRLVLPYQGLTDVDEANLWDTMQQRLKYDADKHMWGFQEGETPDLVEFRGKMLSQ